MILHLYSKRNRVWRKRVAPMDSGIQDKTGIKLGMWLFIYTEIMLFGGLFVLYAAYYSRYTSEFIEYGKTLDVYLGTLNTVVLLISSFTVAAAITAIQKKEKRLALTAVSASILLGALFLVNKYFEWGHKFEDGIYPGSPVLADAEAGKNIFFGLYYVITGLHGIHIVIGGRPVRGRESGKDPGTHEIGTDQGRGLSNVDAQPMFRHLFLKLEGRHARLHRCVPVGFIQDDSLHAAHIHNHAVLGKDKPHDTGSITSNSKGKVAGVADFHDPGDLITP